MANTPTASNASSDVPEPTNVHIALIDALERGETPPQIARRLAKGDAKKAKALRAKIRRMLAQDPILQQAIVSRAHSNLLAAVPGTTAAVGRRAQKGRMDAARTVLESTGVHNPRVKHEHSGDITVKLEMPRPSFHADADADVVGIEDADVVD